ncbi:helix-turn-helix domain-containing protein [Nocardia sp. 348MFTsu5.1]|uniref:winged helix-turn-helix transcriptional regulator n=1 Tax=Nocardia sp. 348MFTsu5.1 TaxID=1172185 RepID=UPI000377C864|nr:helix-turn-helix domain-containing protein [Nocardia sp. 348MFTsu5.1]
MPREIDVTHEPRVCDGALRDAFTLLGKRWNGVLLGSLMHGPAGFAELRTAIGGISDSMLSGRLVELAEAGVIERTVESGPPVSVSYRLTPSGEALMPILEGLTRWAAVNLCTREN